MKIATTIILAIVCAVASFISGFQGEVYHSIELMGIAVLLTASIPNE